MKVTIEGGKIRLTSARVERVGFDKAARKKQRRLFRTLRKKGVLR